MKKSIIGYVYDGVIKNGWQDKPAYGRFPQTSDSAVMVYRKETPGLVKCKITLIK